MPSLLPGRPGKPVISMEQNKLHLKWLAPSSDGGSDILFYIVEGKIHHGDWEGIYKTKGSETECSIPMPQTDKQWRVRIVAVNELGTGEPSHSEGSFREESYRQRMERKSGKRMDIEELKGGRRQINPDGIDEELSFKRDGQNEDIMHGMAFKEGSRFEENSMSLKNRGDYGNEYEEHGFNFKKVEEVIPTNYDIRFDGQSQLINKDMKRRMQLKSIGDFDEKNIKEDMRHQISRNYGGGSYINEEDMEEQNEEKSGELEEYSQRNGEEYSQSNGEEIEDGMKLKNREDLGEESGLNREDVEAKMQQNLGGYLGENEFSNGDDIEKRMQLQSGEELSEESRPIQENGDRESSRNEDSYYYEENPDKTMQKQNVKPVYEDTRFIEGNNDYREQPKYKKGVDEELSHGEGEFDYGMSFEDSKNREEEMHLKSREGMGEKMQFNDGQVGGRIQFKSLGGNDGLENEYEEQNEEDGDEHTIYEHRNIHFRSGDSEGASTIGGKKNYLQIWYIMFRFKNVPA